jgi:hypothetical protein
MLARSGDRRLRIIEYMNPIIENKDLEGTEVAGALRSRRAMLVRALVLLSYYKLLIEYYN